MGLPEKSAVLPENPTSTAKNSRSTVNFCTPKARFSNKVSARREEKETKLVSGSYPEPKPHLDFINVSTILYRPLKFLYYLCHHHGKQMLAAHLPWRIRRWATV